MSYHTLNRYYLRKDFSRIKKVMEKPSLLDVQRKSYEEFLQRYTKPQDRGYFGLQAVFKSVFPIKDFSETAFLEYVSYTLGEPKYDVDECRRKELTYAVPLKVMLRLVVWELALLEMAIDDDPPQTLQNIGIIRAGYSSELDGGVEASRHARDWINNLETVERERTGIRTLKVGYNKVFGYYIEISQGQIANAPTDYLRKQTLVNAERYITPEMKDYETLVLNAEERIREIELRLFKEICIQLSNSSKRLLQTARTLAELDTLGSLAEVASLNGYNRPTIDASGILEIHEGRHPVVEKGLKEERFVPNDIIFEQGEIVQVITGPNMSGKSTYLRQAALIVGVAYVLDGTNAAWPDRLQVKLP